jgi:hypothetical protein
MTATFQALHLAKCDVRGPGGVLYRRAQADVRSGRIDVTPRLRTGEPFTIIGVVTLSAPNGWTVADESGTWQVSSCGCGGSKHPIDDDPVP